MARPILLLWLLCSADVTLAQNKPYRLPAVDLKQRVIWGSECIVDDNLGLQFGGQDQEVGGGVGTKVRRKGGWKPLDDIRTTAVNDTTPELHMIEAAVRQQRRITALCRRWYLSDLPYDAFKGKAAEPLLKELLSPQIANEDLRYLVRHLLPMQSDEERRKTEEDLTRADEVKANLERSFFASFLELDRTIVPDLNRMTRTYELAAELFRIEPGPRSMSPIVYDKSSNFFLVFGGDHLDYLTNDTWVFDPAQLRWDLRLPKSAPSPRANHKLTANGDGTITLSGGYTYANNIDYMGGQYVDIGDGEWTYDIAKNAWTGGKGVSPLTRTYRTGKFHPDYYLQGPRPNRKAHQEVLESLPANQWISLKPPHLPEMNRDWGTAVLDPDRDLILRWSGGHCAHSGSDVLHYHIATNRWELPFPVEFPLGQCYVNTEFPEGTNFNGRPWVTGHTYQSYGYDPHLKKMVFAGRQQDCFVWDPDLADWHGRFAKPQAMSYDSCFFTLTLTSTPQGLICWTQEGRIFQFDGKDHWQERKLTGDKLPGAVVDNSTIVYDAKRHRLLAVSKPYGDETKFSGELYAVDCASWKVSRLQPAGSEAAAAVPYLCQLRYDAEHDLLLVGGTLPPDDVGLRRTPSYDCAGNRWISLKITGDDPSGPKGRNVSLGMMYDAKRKLFLAVDAKSNVFALKLKPDLADTQPLQ